MTGIAKNAKAEKRDMGRAFLFALAVMFAFDTPDALAGSVQPSAEQVASYEQATEGARIKLLIALAKQGQHELADTMLQRYPLAGKYAGNRTLYIEGLILVGRKNNKAAVAKFRAALADDPKLSLVRTDLAAALVAIGEDDSAKHHLQLLEAEAPDAQVASNFHAMIEQIKQNSPYKFNAYVSLAPSTNINNGSSHDKVETYNIFDNTTSYGEVVTRGKSGVGAAVGGGGSYTKRISETWAATVYAGANARLYSDKSFDSFGLNQSIDLNYSNPKGGLSVGAFTSETLSSDLAEIPFYAFGPRATVSYKLALRDVIVGTTVYERRNYTSAKAFNGWASYNDLSWQHFLAPGSFITTSVGFNRMKSGEDTSYYKTWYAGIELYKELPHGITADLSTRAQYSTFDIFNATGQKFRKDTRLIGSLGLVKRDWNMFGFAPSVEYTFVKNFSNLDVYDYNSHNFDVRLTKNF